MPKTPVAPPHPFKDIWLKSIFWLGLVLILAYWYSIHPLGFARGYSEDMCTDIVRQLMAENLQKFGSPKFHFDQFMAPYGVSAPFMSWTIERDWIGAYFWMWNRDFPFLWVYFGVSLLISYMGVGLILKKMKLSAPVAWAIATGVVLFHVPRHYKIWHHFEHLPQHWIYLSFFLDAWIWQRFFREKRWSWNLELWRGICLVGMTWSAGYFWSVLLFEWLIVRSFLGITGLKRHRRGIKTEVEGTWKGAALPITIGVVMTAITARWFLPLYREVASGGEVFQMLAWYAYFRMIWRPLWIYPIVSALNQIFDLGWNLATVDTPETVVTVGWFYWVPAMLGLYFLRKKRGGPGFMAAWPFLLLLILGINYAVVPNEHIIAGLMYNYIPFMKFFRVASRWGLFLPQMLTILVVLAWPELSARVAKWRKNDRTRKKFAVYVCVFAGLSCLEFPFMLEPVNMQPPMPGGVESMLKKIHDLPGTTVMSLPFCVAGGNGVCTEFECPNYPFSITGSCFREWHDKNVYGLYQSRMLQSHCQIYDRPPYQTWFTAWREQRCFTDVEWDQFCQNLDEHPELSAILIFPDIWRGVDSPSCRSQLEARLGPPLDEQVLLLSPTRGGEGANPARVRWYPPKCVKHP